MRKCGLPLWVVIASVLCSETFPVWALSQDYLPLTPKEAGGPFPLENIGVLDEKPRTSASIAGPGGSIFTVANGMLSLEGKDSQKKSWRVDLVGIYGCEAGEGGVRVYQGDLDRDGVIDAIIMKPTCGVGLAPTVHLMAITFDNVGRPLPFEAAGYFEDH